MIKDIFKIKTKDIGMILFLEFFGFILGAILMFAIISLTADETEGYFEMATIFAAMFFVFVCIFLGVGNFIQDYNMAVMMGKTRKNFLVSYGVFSTVEIAVAELFLYLLYRLERVINLVIYRGREHDIEVTWEIFFNVKVFFLVLITVFVLKYFCGAFLLKFLKKANMILLLIWMVFCASQTRILQSEWFANLFETGVAQKGSGVLVVIWAVTMVALSIVAVRMLSKQEVTR